mgnify:CR=1 FL=1
MNVVSILRKLLRQVRPVADAIVSGPAAAGAAGSTGPVAWTPPLSLDDQLRDANLTLDQWLTSRRAQAALYADISDTALTLLRERYPDRVAQTIAAADRVCAHEFDLLGSGPKTIVDATRPVEADGYRPIDWNVDPILGLQFPTGFPHKAWNPSMRPGLADIKWPWEIGRCQHWVTLGQAYRLTRDERYAREIVREHDDFIAVNPTGIGVQFVCTMDVAIRAYNWAIAFDLIRESSTFKGETAARAYRSLFDVGQFIIAHLENTYEVTSNHFLSNIVGLYGVGVVYASMAEGRRWIDQCRTWIDTEMQVQVLSDGADYESSVPYHRLVAELFLGAAHLGAFTGAPFSSAYLDRLRLMIEFHEALLRPDGMMPQVGDADDGRLHIFSEYGSWRPQDGRHLLGPAGAFFSVDEWIASGGECARWEAAWWGFDPHPFPATAALPARAKLFPDAGLAVYRDGAGQYLLITNGKVGTNGFGNHKHNDLLAFEYHAGGVPLLVDPGSYLYTSDPDARNLFRATRAHNTLMLDGIEQNDIRLDYLFRMFETSVVSQRAFTVSPDGVEYRGAHTGYERLSAPVTHERTVTLATAGPLSIVDRLTGNGAHTCAWHFHFAPGVVVDAQGATVVCTAGSHRYRVSTSASLEVSVSDAWYSPSFGVRVPCRAADFTVTADVSSISPVTFVIERM